MLPSLRCRRDVSCSTSFATTVIPPIWMKMTTLVVNIAPMYVILVGKSGHMLVLKSKGTHWQCLTCSLSAVDCCWGSVCLLCCRLPQLPSMPAIVFRAKIAPSLLRPVACNSAAIKIFCLKTRLTWLCLLLLRLLPRGTPWVKLILFRCPTMGV